MKERVLTRLTTNSVIISFFKARIKFIKFLLTIEIYFSNIKELFLFKELSFLHFKERVSILLTTISVIISLFEAHIRLIKLFLMFEMFLV